MECGASSDGLITAPFPAAITFTRGESVVNMGKFQDPITHTTPNGSYTILLSAGPTRIGVPILTG